MHISRVGAPARLPTGRQKRVSGAKIHVEHILSAVIQELKANSGAKVPEKTSWGQFETWSHWTKPFGALPLVPLRAQRKKHAWCVWRAIALSPLAPEVFSALPVLQPKVAIKLLYADDLQNLNLGKHTEGDLDAPSPRRCSHWAHPRPWSERGRSLPDSCHRSRADPSWRRWRRKSPPQVEGSAARPTPRKNKFIKPLPLIVATCRVFGVLSFDSLIIFSRLKRTSGFLVGLGWVNSISKKERTLHFGCIMIRKPKMGFGSPFGFPLNLPKACIRQQNPSLAIRRRPKPRALQLQPAATLDPWESAGQGTASQLLA